MKHLELFAADEFAVCDSVLTETCFHLRHRNQRQRLRALLHDLGVQPVPVTNERTGGIAVLSEWSYAWWYEGYNRQASRNNAAAVKAGGSRDGTQCG